MRSRYPPEIDAGQLQHIIRSIYCGTLRSLRTIGGPSLDLCRSLLALRDPGLGGRLSLDYVPIVINLLKFWKVCLSVLLMIAINLCAQREKRWKKCNLLILWIFYAFSTIIGCIPSLWHSWHIVVKPKYLECESIFIQST